MSKRALATLTVLLAACETTTNSPMSGSHTTNGPTQVDDSAGSGADGSTSESNEGGTPESGPTPEEGAPSPEQETAPDPGDEAAMIAVRLTDAPGDFEAVPVTIARIEAHFLGADAPEQEEQPETESDDGEEPPPPSEGADEDASETEDPAETDAPESDVEETGVWVTLVSEPQAFDLLTLQNGVSAALGDALVEAGQYDQIRLIVSEASVVVDGETHELDVPSGEQTGFKLSYDYQVDSGGSYELMLDFDAHQSIRQRGNGQYFLQPVITVAYFGPPQEHAEDGASEDDASEEDGSGDEGERDTGSWDTGMGDTGH